MLIANQAYPCRGDKGLLSYHIKIFGIGILGEGTQDVKRKNTAEPSSTVDVQKFTMVMGEVFAFVVFVEFFIEEFPLITRLEHQLWLYRYLYFVSILFFYTIYKILYWFLQLDCTRTVHTISNFWRLRAGLEFGFTHLCLRIKGLGVFLKLSSEYDSIICLIIEQKPSVEIEFFSSGVPVVLPFTKTFSIYKMPSVITGYYQGHQYWILCSYCSGAKWDVRNSTKSVMVWDPYWFP